MKKRLLPALLALVMVLGLLPLSVLAAPGTDETDTVDPGTPAAEALDLAGSTIESLDQASAPMTVTGEATKEVTLKPTGSLKLYPAQGVENEPGYRPVGWWVGTKISAPTAITEDNLANAKFGDRNNTNVSFAKFSSGSTGAYTMTNWCGIRKAALEEDPTKTDYTLRMFFNWDGDEETGDTVDTTTGEAPTDATPAEKVMKGVDQTFIILLDLKQTSLVNEDGETLLWEYNPTVTVEPDENGEVELADTAVSSVIAAATEEGSTDKTATIEAAAVPDKPTSVTLPAGSMGTVNDAAENDEEFKFAVSVPDVATVTFDKSAISAISTAAADGASTKAVTISVQDVKDVVAVTDKPSNSRAAYEVKVLADAAALEESDWTGNPGITLTVPAPMQGDGTTPVALEQMEVYLDNVKDEENACELSASATDGCIDVKVPHLTVVALAAVEYDITLNGSNPSDAVSQTTAAEGDIVTVTTASVAGKSALITVEDEDGNSIPVTHDNKFTMPAGPVTVTVTYKSSYSIEVSGDLNTTRGTITIAGSLTQAAAGQTVTFNVAANSGYAVKAGKVKVMNADDAAQTVAVTENEDGSYSFTMPGYNVSITAEFQGASGATYEYKDGQGLFLGQIEFEGLTGGKEYIVQVAKNAKNSAKAIMFLEAEGDGSATLNVLGNPGGYTVELFMNEDTKGSYSWEKIVPVPVADAAAE